MKNKKIIKNFTSIFLLLILFIGIFSFKNNNNSLINNNNIKSNYSIDQKEHDDGNNGDWGFGHGIDWEDHYFAPFVDIADWADVSNHGVPNVSDKYKDGSKSKYFNFGFINSLGSAPSGTIQWTWGGFPTLNHNNPDDQGKQIEKEVREVRDKGGDVAFSFGGNTNTLQAPKAFWMTGASVETLVSTYEEIINGYGLTRIDLDVEGGNEDLTANKKNVEAIKKVQDDTGVKVVLTLPIGVSGLDYQGTALLDAYLDAGVELDKVNVMAMLLGGDEGDSDISAVKGLQKQIITAYGKKGIVLSDKEAYEKVGSTNSIGAEQSHNFSFDDAKDVTSFAKDNDIGELSMWVANRDAHEGGYSGSSWGGGYLGADWQYSNIYRDFKDHDSGGGGDKTAPTVPSNIVKDGEPTEDTINIKWDPSTDESGGSGLKDYTIKIDDDATSGSTYSETFTTTENKYKFEGLTQGTKYNVKILATDNAGNSSSYSSSVSFETKAKTNQPPGDITLLEQTTGTETSDSITVDWNSVTDPDGDTVHYMAQKNNDAAINVNSDTSYKFEWLSPNTSYKIKVWAVDDKGLEGGSKEASFTTEDSGGGNQPPSDISALRPTGVTENSITISWNQSIDPDGDGVYYMVGIDDGRSEFKYEVSPSPTIQYTFDNLSPNTTYNIDVTPYDSKDLGGSTETLNGVKTKQTNLPPSDIDASTFIQTPGTESSNSLTLQWNKATDPEKGDVKYELKINGGGDVICTETNHKFESLSSNTTYSIDIWAVDNKGLKSENVTTKSFTTEDGGGGDNPPKVNNLSRSNVTNTSITISWGKPSFSEDLSYKLEIDGGPDSGKIIEETSNNHTFNNLSNNKEYSITVYAVTSDGTDGEKDTISIKTNNIPKGKVKKDSIMIISASTALMIILIILLIII